ncbi:MAG: hypothetical protein RLZ72_547 [Actinomycetota bacterium]|jgi:hypothetical protein
MKSPWSWSAIAWMAVLGLMASFQLWRGAWVDGTLFALLVATLVIDRLTKGRIRVFRTPPIMHRNWVIAFAAIAAIVLALAPRHSDLDLVVVAALGIGVVSLAWAPAPATPDHPARAYRRAAVWWSVLAVGFCLWEALAYILSVTVSEFDFPTVSVLLDPFLEWGIGRALFTIGWLAGGLWLLRIWGRR